MNPIAYDFMKNFIEWAFADKINPFMYDERIGRYVQTCGNSTSWSYEQLLEMYIHQKHNKNVYGVNINWETKWHEKDLGLVMKPGECRFIGSEQECAEFIKQFKPDVDTTNK